MDRERESKKARAAKSELPDFRLHGESVEEKPLCETGYSWDAKGLSSYSDRLSLRETG